MFPWSYVVEKLGWSSSVCTDLSVNITCVGLWSKKMLFFQDPGVSVYSYNRAWKSVCIIVSLHQISVITHTFWTFSCALCDSSWTWWKALMYTWTLHQFSREAFNFPPTWSSGEKKYWISQHFTGSPCCCHGCWKLPQDMRIENRLWSAGRVSLLLGYCLISSSVRAGFPSVFSQLNCYVRAAPPAGQTHMFQGNIQPAASLKEANWFSGTIYTQPGC